MIENPYEPPQAESSASAVPLPRRASSRRVRLSVFSANCLLLVLFPPGCCPCGFGPIGLLVQPYMILLGFPTIIFGFLASDAIATNRETFFAAYIVNYVVMSYVIGELAGRLFGGKRGPQTVSGDNGCPGSEAVDGIAGRDVA